jgi:hypothetical protein
MAGKVKNAKEGRIAYLAYDVQTVCAWGKNA